MVRKGNAVVLSECSGVEGVLGYGNQDTGLVRRYQHVEKKGHAGRSTGGEEYFVWVRRVPVALCGAIGALGRVRGQSGKRRTLDELCDMFANEWYPLTM